MENPLYRYDKELQERMRDTNTMPRASSISMNMSQSPKKKPAFRMSRQGTFAFGKKFTIRDRKLTLRQNQSPEKDKTPLGKTAKASVDDLKEETFSENES